MSDKYAWFEGEIDKELLAKLKQVSEPDVEQAIQRLSERRYNSAAEFDEDFSALLASHERLRQRVAELEGAEEPKRLPLGHEFVPNRHLRGIVGARIDSCSKVLSEPEIHYCGRPASEHER